MCLAACLGVTASAVAAPIEIAPEIQGLGTITADAAPPFSCGPPASPDVVLTCPARTFDETVTSISLVPTPVDNPADQWSFDRWIGCPSVEGELCLIEAAPGEPTETAAPRAVFVDPAPTLGEVVVTAIARDAVRLTFSSDDLAATFECQLDTPPTAGCASGREISGLAPGPHTFTVWAIDPSGNVSAPVDAPFTVEAPPVATPPVVTPPPTVTPPPPFPALLIPRVLGPSSVKAKVSRKRGLSLGAVRLKCPAVAAPCRATVLLKGRLKKRGRLLVLARASIAVRPSTSVAVRLRLTRKAAKALKDKRRLRATAALTVRAPNVNTRKDVAVTLRAPRLTR